MKITKTKLKQIIREELLGEGIFPVSIEDAGAAIFDVIIEFKKIFQKSPHAKNRKINSYIKQLLKIEQQLDDVVHNLE